MRVIAGKARRLPLKTIEGLDTRPTTDRIKETLFNILQNDLYDIRFLDIFSGSGGIGIEALSRGAKEAVFVENNRAAVRCIQDNLKFTHLEQQATVLPCAGSAGASGGPAAVSDHFHGSSIWKRAGAGGTDLYQQPSSFFCQ